MAARFGDTARFIDFRLSGDEQDLRNPGGRTAEQLVTDRRGATTPDDFSSRSGSRLNLGAGWRLGEADLALNLAWRDREASATQSCFGAQTPSRHKWTRGHCRRGCARHSRSAACRTPS